MNPHTEARRAAARRMRESLRDPVDTALVGEKICFIGLVVMTVIAVPVMVATSIWLAVAS